jgi:hypothetical protein
VISTVTVTPTGTGTATVTWTTDEPATSRVDYGTSAGSLTLYVADPALVTSHTVQLTGLALDTTYYIRVTSVDGAANTATSPNPPADPAAFNTQAGETFGCPCTIFGDTPGTTQVIDTSAYELGVKFQTSVDGWITGVRFYKPTDTTGTHIGKLWSLDGTLLRSATFVETDSGWQTVTFSSPFAVAAGTTYVASYSWPGGYYPFQKNAFTGAGVTSGPLTALQSSVEEGNGVLSLTPGTFPTLTFNDSNYWVDVVFDTSADTTAPTITNRTPAPGAVDVPVDTNVTVTFDEAVDPATITTSTVALRAVEGGTDVPATVSYTGTTATLDPTAALAPSTEYRVTIAASVADPANNQLGTPDTWTFTTAAAPTFNCPCSIWPSSAIPGNADAIDGDPIETGVKFRSEAAGWITGIRFYKGGLNTGTHVGHLWTGDGTLLAEATFTDETASGWQQVTLSPPVAIAADTTYVASYYSPSGYFAIDPGFFTSNGVDNPPLHALQAGGANGPNGVYLYSATGFPTAGNTANYWVDVVFAAEVDTTAPTVTGRTPAPNATDVPVTADVTVTFDEPMNPATITSSTVTLRASAGPDVLATVTYSAGTATLDPTASLAPNTVYTATVKATVTGASGNPLGSDLTWTFRTAVARSSLTDTTEADFAAGTPGANTYVSRTVDGEVILTPTAGSEFSGSSLPGGWSSTPWTTGGTSTVGAAVLTVDGALAATDAYYPSGRSMEFVATFGAATFEHVGFARAFADGEPWAMFSTNATTDTLFARTYTGTGSSIDTSLGTASIGSAHRYRVEWSAGAVSYYVDGSLVHTDSVSIGTTMRPVVSDYDVGGPAVVVDWMRMTPYAASGTFVSRVFDAGDPTTWTTLTADVLTPTDTTIDLETRTSNDQSTWSPWAAVGGGGAIASPAGRYIQYQALLATTDLAQTPVLQQVTLSGTGTIVDTVPPVVSVPSDMSAVEASGPTGAAVTFSASALDNVDGALTPTCLPASGSTFALGATTVTCSATDAAGNTGSATFTVTVVDTTAPLLSDVPADITVPATGPTGAIVTYTAPTATDLVDPAVVVSCLPVSGSLFPIATTTVHCTATDSHGNAAIPADFTVTVTAYVDNVAPTITSANNTAFTVGSAGTFSVTTSGAPTPAISETGTLPSGVTLVDNGNGTATLAGTPGAATAGSYPITITAANGVLPNATQSFTLTVKAPPVNTLSGSFTAGGAPQTGGTVYVFSASAYNYIGAASVDGSGNYSITLPPGSYKLYLAPVTSGYAFQWYGGADWTGATTVTVSGSTTQDIALVPPPVNTLSGSFTAGGAPQTGGTVYVFSASAYNYIGAASVDGSGNYSITLPPGSYKLYLAPVTSGYAFQWYGGADWTGATTVTVSGSTTQDIALVPPPVNTLSGSFTAGGAPQTGGTVYVFSASAYNYIGAASVDGSGNYSITLPPGSYKLYLAPVTSGYAFQWYGGADWTGATTVTVSGSTTQDIALVPPPVNTLSGSFTAGGAPQTGGTVYVFSASAYNYIGAASVDGSGNYSITLPPGSYKLYLAPVTSGYAFQWYGGADWTGATTVTVSGSTTQDIALVPPPVNTLSGSFTAGGAPQTGGTVYVFSASAYNYIGAASVDGSGNYSITLPPGSYKLYLAPVTSGYAFQWYGGADWTGATTVTVSGSTTQDIALVPPPVR